MKLTSIRLTLVECLTSFRAVFTEFRTDISRFKNICSDGTSVFLLLDELDAFCMSRSRAQEHDAVRRAMTTLMLELDKLHPSTTMRLLVFGITNVPNL
jgi:Cdc6-like AAA superfamily ATPase